MLQIHESHWASSFFWIFQNIPILTKEDKNPNSKNFQGQGQSYTINTKCSFPKFNRNALATVA